VPLNRGNGFGKGRHMGLLLFSKVASMVAKRRPTDGAAVDGQVRCQEHLK
jgi:hypothetical protein